MAGDSWPIAKCVIGVSDGWVIIVVNSFVFFGDHLENQSD
jgi:hypothetical protein